ncbi:MAG: restriction endonuclease subunit M [Promethearchaeota archaeon]|nr:MAG: restriction endonuclease subunit M [Candidatus Lokiarchaeota archaeon]
MDDILKRIGLEIEDPENLAILMASLGEIISIHKNHNFKNIQGGGLQLLKNLVELGRDELNFLEKRVLESQIDIKECQIKVQREMPEKERKKFAAYYTTNEGVNLMTSLALEYIKNTKNKKLIAADPFLGSGRTLIELAKRIRRVRIDKIWGIEKHNLSALVAYASLLKGVDGKKDIVHIISGDSFNTIAEDHLSGEGNKFKADIILTNPPFTRWKYLGTNYRDNLLKILNNLGYSKYIIKKETSLQVLSMMLTDLILKDGGLLISVLPASTFYTIYGRGYKELIKEKYHLLAFVESAKRSAFSIDSGFKEIIIVAIKKTNKSGLTAFYTLEEVNIDQFSNLLLSNDYENLQKDKNIHLVNIHKLPRFLDNNWLSLIGNRELKEQIIYLFDHGIKEGYFGYWMEILGHDTLIRGIEMYGPNFFFIGNKYWKIVEEADFIKIKNKNTMRHLSIAKKYLIKTLRKPSLYSYSIKPDVNTYMLSIPKVKNKDLPDDLKEYIKWGIESNTARFAINKFKNGWYSHVFDQIRSKKPFGTIFITDKVDLSFNNRGVFANYSEKELAASKNFYIVKNIDKKYAILLTAWLNSTFILAILIQFSRKISDTWTRLLINDYLELPILNVQAISDDAYKEINKSLKVLLDLKLPPFWDQLGEKYRYDLDLSIAKAINIENPKEFIENLYTFLEAYHQKL